MPSLDRGREIAKPRRRRELRAPRRGEAAWSSSLSLPFARTFSWSWRLLRWLMPERPLDALAAAVATAAAGAVLVNALLLQPAPHPAPLFAEAPKPTVPAAPAPAAEFTPVPLPRPETASIRAKPGLVLDLQRGLAERGYYDGELDGLLGPRTQQAIRDFEQAHGLKASGEPSEGLLARVLRARARGEITGAVPAAEPRPSMRVLAVQRVLARLGYGPLSFNGRPDAATRGAVERFERDRGLAATGEIDERLLKELATVTGAPVE